MAMDTTFILGRGAVKDTYNLLADGIVQLVRALADPGEDRGEGMGRGPRVYENYIGSSMKGEACIDWGDKRERAALLSRIVGDAPRGCWSVLGRYRGDCRRTALSGSG